MKTYDKTKLATAIAMMMMTPLAFAEIELGKGVTVTGFIDMSGVYSKTDVTGSVSTSTFQIDQFETDFMYSGSAGVSAQVDIEYGESGDDSGADETFVEQAFITKKFTDQFSAKIGRFLSYTGWETEEPTGLYQYSGTGYGGIFYGGYQQGVSASYNVGKFAVMGSVVNNAFNPVDSNARTTNLEVGASISPMESVTAKLFYINDSDDALINFWASYAQGPYTVAVEYNTRDNDDDNVLANGYKEANGYLLMGNYAMGNFGVTLRYHAWEKEDGAGTTTEDMSGITLAPSYQVGENLLLVAEYRMDTDDSASVDTDTIAIEALFTF